MMNLGGVLFVYQFDPHRTNDWVWPTLARLVFAAADRD
jgi:hypothetical protein